MSRTRSRYALYVSAVLTAVFMCFASSSAQPSALPDDAPMIQRPWTNDPAKFTFAVVGDKTGGNASGWPYFDAAVDHINRIRPDFAIMIGDLVEGYTNDSTAIEEQWDEFLAHANRLEVPMLVLPGNHDYTSPELIEAWQRRMGRTYYSFDWKGCHFVLLNTEEERDGAQDFGEEQMAFIREDLGGSGDARHTFVFMHRPAWRFTEDMNYNTDWPRIVEELGSRPYSIFAGHWHHLIHERIDGHDYTIMGATGGAMRPSDYLPLGKFHHWTHVAVDGDSVHISHIPCGESVLPTDIARASFIRDGYRLASVDGLPPERRGDVLRAGFRVTLENVLSDTAMVSLTTRAQGNTMLNAWRDTTITVAPGDESHLDMYYEANAGLNPPRLGVNVVYNGETLGRFRRRVPLVPVDILRVPDAWRVTEPVRVTELPADWTTLPRSETTRNVSPTSDGTMWLNRTFGMADFSLSFATTRIYSPAAQDTWIGFWVEEKTTLILNGVRIAEDRDLDGSSGNVIWIPVHLNEGWNTLTVGVHSVDSFYGFGLRIADPTGTLRFSTE